MPRTRCSRASSSTLGSAPRVAGRGLRVGSAGVGSAGVGSLRVGATRIGVTRIGGGFARCGGFARGGFGGRRLTLGRTVLGRTVLGRTAPGWLGLARGLALLGALRGGLVGLALLGRSLDALLLVLAWF